MSRKPPISSLDLHRQCPRRKPHFSIYDLAPRSQPPEPAEDVHSFIERISSPASRPLPPPKKPVPVRTVLPKESPRVVETGSAVKSLEKALEQERELSESLRKRVVELEIAVGKQHIHPAPRPLLLPLPLPVPSNSSEWRQRLEEVQKKQLERLVGRGCDIII